MIRKSQFALAAAALIAAPAFAAPAFDANIELDNDYRNYNRGMGQGGRVEMNVFSKTDKGGGFVAGRASYMAGKSGSAGVDDMWVQIGNSTGDVKLGRFEAADLFPAGKDTVVDDDAVGGYRGNAFRGRVGTISVTNANTGSTYADGVLHAAVNVNAAPGLTIEVGVIGNRKNVGIRPVIGYSANGFNAKLGFETGRTVDGSPDQGAKVNGVALTVGTTMSGAALNLNLASGKTGDVKSSSFGVNAVFGAAGVGYIYDKTGDAKEHNVYAAYSLPLFDTGATITPAIGYSKASGGAGQAGDSNAAITARVRVNYAF